ncbi:hypothetical protein KGQ71_03935, partial [Patescibacteria group bacterium]|nr:hypothetical protein [Patescibacteria group bacterium]
TFSQTTFLNNQTAWLATPNTHTAASMRQYFLQHDKYIYIIGVLEKPANADDQQRLNQMLNSIQFLSVSS